MIAQTAGLAIFNMNLEFTYGCDSENADMIYVEVKNSKGEVIQAIESKGMGGTSKEKKYKGEIKAGDVLVFKYVKDGSVHTGSDIAYFKDIKRTGLETGNWSYIAIK